MGGDGRRRARGPGSGPTDAPLPVPDLVGGSVRLRAWADDDADALAAAWADGEIARWTGVPADRSAPSAQRWIRGDADRRRRRVALDLVVAPADPDADRVLGEVGLGPIQWDRRRAMIGYWTAAPERDRGIAREAIGLLAPWALHALPLDELVAETSSGNPASGAVLRSAGFDLAVTRGARQAWRYRGPRL
jgi:RimJ/RimL family protein N-acetyltransferase